MVSISYRATSFVTCFVIIMAGGAGCFAPPDECVGGTTRCSGGTYQSCDWTGEGSFSHTTWRDSLCDGSCVEAGGRALCVDSTERVPECAQDGPACWQGRTTDCIAGFPTGSRACDNGTHCVISAARTIDCGAICALGDAPDPRCGPTSGPAFCDGASRVSCNCGYPQRRDDCGAVDLCRSRDDVADCLLSPAPDPRCGDPSAPQSGFCASNTFYPCWYGYPLRESIACGPGTCFVGGPFGGGCQL
jgi:hypothetical protein